MRAKSLPPTEVLRQLFDYNPRSGYLIWRDTGFLAGTIGERRGKPSGMSVEICGFSFVVHRIIWAIVHGHAPEDLGINHRDGNPWHNRLDNLRLATTAQNSQNRRVRSDSKTGFKGVYRNKHGAFYALKRIDGRLKYLGQFETPQEAHAAYCKVAAEMYGEFARFA